MPIGDARSTHIELVSPDPANVLIDCGRTYIEVGKDRIHPEELFGDASSNASNVQHFYTTKTKSQIEKFRRDRFFAQQQRQNMVRNRHKKNELMQQSPEETDKKEETLPPGDYNIWLRVIYTPIKSIRLLAWFSMIFPVLSIAAFILILSIWGKHVLTVPVIFGLGFSPALITILAAREKEAITMISTERRKKIAFYLVCGAWLFAVILLIIFVAA